MIEVTARAAEEAFVIFAAASCIYSLVQLFISSGAFDTNSATTMGEMRAQLVQLRLLMKPVAQLKIWQELALIVALVLTPRLIPHVQESKLLKNYKGLKQLVKLTYLAVTAAVSFSIAGSCVGSAVGNIRMHLESEIDYVESSFASMQHRLEVYANKDIALKVSSAPNMRGIVSDLASFKGNVAAAEAERNRGLRNDTLADTEPSFNRSVIDFNRGIESLSRELNNDRQLLARAKEEKSDLSIQSRDSADRVSSDLNNSIANDFADNDLEVDLDASGMKAVVEKAADLSGEELVKHILDAVLSLYPADPQLEAFKALYEPIAKAPVQEMIKKAARKGYERLVARSEDPEGALREVRSTLSAIDMNASVGPGATIAAAIKERHIESAGFVPEIRRSIELADEVKVAQAESNCSKAWEHVIASESNPRLRRAARDDLRAIVRRSASRIPADDLVRRAKAIEDLTALLDLLSSRDSFREWILALEDESIREGAYLATAMTLAGPRLENERSSRWGRLRAQMDYDVPRWNLKSTAKEKALQSLRRWQVHRLVRALSTAKEGAPISSNEWDQDFYQMTRSDIELAVLWGFHLEQRIPSDVGKFMEEYHLLDFPDRTVRPKFSYAYYAEGSFGGDWAEIISRFRSPAGLEAVNTICEGGTDR